MIKIASRVVSKRNRKGREKATTDRSEDRPLVGRRNLSEDSASLRKSVWPQGRFIRLCVSCSYSLTNSSFFEQQRFRRIDAGCCHTLGFVDHRPQPVEFFRCRRLRIQQGHHHAIESTIKDTIDKSLGQFANRAIGRLLGDVNEGSPLHNVADEPFLSSMIFSKVCTVL